MQEAAVRGLAGLAPLAGRLPIPIPLDRPPGRGVRVDARTAAGGLQ